ncbi:MAG TPA: RNA polymerase sigma factor [Rhodopirellula baltica]|uniref:Probable sigma-70 factor, ECF subfamily n=1 Tax=Rhodopirellula baltica (strain DSM 10527 / NCIMB 13988 / SH1) TaxID=243090 RepID=Q7UYJ4_RHOBA|nr:RNA polymerase sigma factor [Rhodopirellula baltica]CAD71648.1 probable sigma-70 factor, ECF subfamily [Rhodopirellula baltica SH 1]HBE63323.1 RNA polymerase sigma factor [Rhodopirellula baltica]
MSSAQAVSNQIDRIYRTESRKVFATLVRVLGDFDVAEEAMHDAFAAAMENWARDGIPDNPTAWLISTGRFKAVDRIRRRRRFDDLQPELVQRIDQIELANNSLAEQDIQDDRLRLIFTCCHPAIDQKVQVPLTLREVCGMTTDEIARAFLVAPSTLAQRIVRGKAKIRDAGIPFSIPSLSELPSRLDAVLSVIYLVFNEGYSATSGDTLLRTDLSAEAIRLARLLLELLPDPEVAGLLALMLLHESRRTARVNEDGDIVLLEDQDRSLWDQELIEEGSQLLQRSLRTRRIGTYTIQAAISAVHAEAERASATDWSQIVALYDVLLRIQPSPVVELNRAVAIAMRDTPAEGLKHIEAILDSGHLRDHYLAHSARGELLRRMGEDDEAIRAFEQALSLAMNAPEQRFLHQKLTALKDNAGH